MKQLMFIQLFLFACSGLPVTASQPLSWEKNHFERKIWSDKLIQITTETLSQFDKAKDAKKFCSKYASLSDEQKAIVWAEVVVWTAFYESRWNPALHYKEPPPLGYDSIGLLQLSYEDKHYKFCDLDRKTKSLENPLKNLDCGARIMAKLISNAGVVSDGKKGAAAYWSTLRQGKKLGPIASNVNALKFCK